ncbi:MAG: hypothetical protein ACD_33C00045G0005 [uncultured bacterium]|nr:MAG: hypothetical protein ACD_33C00045G0005 [uncultured bacterium]
MIVNPKIKEVLNEIAKTSIEFGNVKDERKNYLKRILYIYKTRLSDEEQLFIFTYLLDHVHFKNIATDPDTVLLMHNVKLRTYAFIFFLIIIGISLTIFLLFYLDKIDVFMNDVLNIIKLLSIV